MDIRESLKKLASLVKCNKEIEGIGTVYFRSLPGYYLLKMTKDKGEEAQRVDLDPELMLEMIENCACDEKGILLFDTDEMKAILKSLPMEALNELSLGVSEASGWGKNASEDIEKNSETVA